jgi:DNA-directed RNA polymerase specialized sigma24 family protein
MVLRYLIPKARQARAALYGAPSDDQKYSTRTIRALLPALWSDEHAERPESEIRSHSDPAIGGNWTPMTVDVHKAFQLIGTAEQAILLLRYGLGDDWRDIAAQSCSSESAVRLRADRAITQMADHLNGLDERLYPFEPVGTIRTQSNARARFSTDAVYNGEGV